MGEGVFFWGRGEQSCGVKTDQRGGGQGGVGEGGWKRSTRGISFGADEKGIMCRLWDSPKEEGSFEHEFYQEMSSYECLAVIRERGSDSREARHPGPAAGGRPAFRRSSLGTKAVRWARGAWQLLFLLPRPLCHRHRPLESEEPCSSSPVKAYLLKRLFARVGLVFTNL